MKSVSHIILATLVASGGAAIAGDKGQHDKQASSKMQQTSGQQQVNFKQADRNNDQRVSRDEANQAGADFVVVNFQPLDQDGNGYLDENEWDYNETNAGLYDNVGNEVTGNFNYYDANNDGYLDENEVGQDDYLSTNFNSFDNNQDGFIDVMEANDGFMEWGDDSFDTYDANDDGFLDENEVADYDYVNYNFNDWDTDGDGLLGYNEVEDTWYNDDSDYNDTF